MQTTARDHELSCLRPSCTRSHSRPYPTRWPVVRLRLARGEVDMRWFWGYLSVLALLTIAGCAGTNSAAADQTPTPTWSMKIETADPSPPPLSSPVPPIVQPSLTPSGPPPP